MSDDESVEVDSVADEEEGLQANDVSAASTSASTPQPALQQPTPAMLQELLQLRAKQAIEGAKARSVVRENQRMADDFVHSIIQRVVQKLGWLEEAKQGKEKQRKKKEVWSSIAGLSPDRPSRRRERKREFRNRQHPAEYEEVPGGGQFLMMLLSKNKQTQPAAGSKSNISRDEVDRDVLAVRSDPAIVQVSTKGWSSEQGHDAATAKVEAASTPAITSGNGKASSSRSRGKASGSAGDAVPRSEPEPAPLPPAPSNKGAARAAARAEASERRRAMGEAAAAAKAAKEEEAALELAKKAAKTAGRRARQKGAQPPEQLNLQSLLRGAGVTENGSDSVPRHKNCNVARLEQEASPAKLSCQASSDIFGKLQKLMGAEQDKALQSPAPMIPPMPGFSTIWGSPGTAPSSSPAGSPWLGSSSDPWAPLPPSALDSAAREQNSKLPPPLSEVWPGQEAPRHSPDGPTGVEALETRPRGRRGGRNHRDKKKESKDGQKESKKLDLWDMPMDRSSHADVHNSLADLPEFFRDSAAPAFVDYFLEDSSSSKKCGLELELELDLKGPLADWNRGQDGADHGKDPVESPTYDGAVIACIGSLCLEEDDDDM